MDDLVKLTVNLLPESIDALNQAAEYEENTRTDTINRALQIYGMICDLRAQHCQIMISHPDGMLAELKWFN